MKVAVFFLKNTAKTKVSLRASLFPDKIDGGLDQFSCLSVYLLPSAEKSDAVARSRQAVSRFVRFVAWLATLSLAKHRLPGEANDQEKGLAGSLICPITAISFMPRLWQCSELCHRESICVGNAHRFMTRDSSAAVPPTPSEARLSSTK